MSDINKLERIKQAYYSGLKVQIWFNGYWENFDARDYSMYSDPFSENRQYRIVGSAYADIAEKRIKELEEENAELKTRVKNQKSFLERIRAKFNLGKLERKEIEGYLTNEQLSAAKDLIRNLLRVTYGEGWNYSLDVKVKAEQFLKEVGE